MLSRELINVDLTERKEFLKKFSEIIIIAGGCLIAEFQDFEKYQYFCFSD